MQLGVNEHKHFFLNRHLPASETPLKPPPFAGLLNDVFDQAIIPAAALTGTAEASAAGTSRSAVLADRAVLTALFGDARLTGVTVTALDASHSLPSVADAVRMIREAFAGIWGIIADQPQAVQDAAWAEVRAAFSRFETAGGFVAPAQFHVVGGRKPG
jgi:hypothetical protein